MRLFVAFLTIMPPISCAAQENIYQHALSGEIGGLGADGITAQYDYMFKHSARGFYDVRLGIGGFIFPNSYFSGITIPHAVTYNFGKRHHYFEAGGGGMFIRQYYWDLRPTSLSGYLIGPMIGYRSISSRGFQFRFYFNVFYSSDGYLQPWAGIGFGKAFRKK